MDDEVKVRIALAIDHEGSWVASGYSGDQEPDFGCVIDTLHPGERRYIIEAVVKKPAEVETVAGNAREIPSDPPQA